MQLYEFLSLSPEDGTQLTTLCLTFNCLCRLSADQWASFWVAATAHPQLSSLDLSFNRLRYSSTEQWTAFCAGINTCQQLTRLYLNGNIFGNLRTDQWASFWAGVAFHPQLTLLSLRHNQLCKLSINQWRAFWAGISLCPQLTTLDLRHNHLYILSAEKSAIFWEGLAQCKQLKKLFVFELRLAAINPELSFEHIEEMSLSAQWIENQDDETLVTLGRLFPYATIALLDPDQNNPLLGESDRNTHSEKIAYFLKHTNQKLLGACYALSHLSLCEKRENVYSSYSQKKE